MPAAVISNEGKKNKGMRLEKVDFVSDFVDGDSAKLPVLTLDSGGVEPKVTQGE